MDPARRPAPDPVGRWLDRLAERVPRVIDVHTGFVVIAALPVALGGLALTEVHMAAGIIVFVAGLALAQMLWRRYHPDGRRAR